MTLDIKAAIGLVLLILLAATFFQLGQRSGEAQVREIKLQHAKDARHVANLALAAVKAARATEQVQAKALFAIGEAYEKGRDDAFNRGKAAAAGVRSGAVQLRDHWACAKPASRVPPATAGAGQSDEGAELRAEGAGRIVQIGAECDAQVAGLQAAVIELGGAP